MKAGDIVGILKQTFQEFGEDKVTRLAAALAYYTIFSLTPLLILSLAVAGVVFDRGVARAQLLSQVRGLMGETGAELIGGMLENASQPEAGGIAAIVSVVTLVIGASAVFGQLQDALNTIWGVMPRPGLNIGYIIRQRVLSFTLVLGIGFLLLVSLIASTLISAAQSVVFGNPDEANLLIQLLNNVIAVAVIALMFAVLFKYLPDVNISWHDVWVGAIVTSVLFNVGKYLIGLYLGNSSAASVYGAAGSLVVLLLWIYYSGLILFFGAEFTQVYATRYGSHIEPTEAAIPLTAEARARQGIPQKPDVEAAIELQDARNRVRAEQRS
jgi:membrane protein